MHDFSLAAGLLPAELRACALALPDSIRRRAEELRLRTGYPPTVVLPEGERAIPGRAVSGHDLECVLTAATGASVHTASDSIRNGYVTARGGVRLGLCGTASVQDGEICGIRRLTSVCIRIPRQCRGCADAVYAALTEDGFTDTLLVSPPGGGKTTLLRELVRRLSESGYRVALADERGEVAGVCGGAPRFDVGAHTDVLTGAPKGTGALLLLRAMSPQVLAMDEITAAEDLRAARFAANCGVRLLATAHAGDLDELRQRPAYRTLLREKIFRRAVIIGIRGAERSYQLQQL